MLHFHFHRAIFISLLSAPFYMYKASSALVSSVQSILHADLFLALLNALLWIIGGSFCCPFTDSPSHLPYCQICQMEVHRFSFLFPVSFFCLEFLIHKHSLSLCTRPFQCDSLSVCLDDTRMERLGHVRVAEQEQACRPSRDSLFHGLLRPMGEIEAHLGLSKVFNAKEEGYFSFSTSQSAKWEGDDWKYFPHLLFLTFLSFSIGWLLLYSIQGA